MQPAGYLGLVVTPLHLPSARELEDLKPPFLRSILYRDSDLDTLIAQGIPLWLTVNNEWSRLGGWDVESAADFLVAHNRGGFIWRVSWGNEFDLYWKRDRRDVPPDFAGDLVRRAHPILQAAGIETWSTSVVTDELEQYLSDLVSVAQPYLDGLDVHPYGQRPTDWGSPGWMFGDLDPFLAHLEGRFNLPIGATEYGVTPHDAGSEAGQAEWITAAEGTLADRKIYAAYFSYHDLIGQAHERWDSGHGLLRPDGGVRPAYLAYAALPRRSPLPPTPEPVDPPPSPQEPGSTPVLVLNPWEFFSASQISEATGAPRENVQDQWPRLHEQLTNCGIADRPVQVAMIATVAIESASTFLPVREAFYLGEPEPAESYRRTLRYYPHYGRGHIQCTLASNYAIADDWISEIWTDGAPTGVDPVANPDALLDSDYSAAFAACYFRNHGGHHQNRIPEAARRGDWTEVRRLVQGADAGLPRLIQIANRLVPVQVPTSPEVNLADYVFPVAGYQGEVNLHWGVYEGGSDIFAERGTAVVAVHSGTVVYRQEWGPVGGNAIQLVHDGDDLESYYAHGNNPPAVQEGQYVTKGTYLFGVGDSGNATAAGPHLHFGLGRSIILGSGPTGGCGSEFDAVSLLKLLRDQQPTTAPHPAAHLISTLGYLGGDVARRLEENRAGLKLPEYPRSRSKMLKADWKNRADKLEAMIHAHYAEDGQIKDEIIRAAGEALNG